MILRVFFCSAFFLLNFTSGCREPMYKGPSESYEPDGGGEFDAGPPDDAGNPDSCLEGTPDLFNNTFSPFFGGEEVIDLDVVHFSNFHCPHCAHLAELTRDLWERRAEYKKRVRVYFHHFPFGTESTWQHHAAAVAAANQGMEHFFAMHDLIYDGMNASPAKFYTEEDLIIFAQNELKLDMKQFNIDMQSDKTISFLQWDLEQGERVGVSGTPSAFLCGVEISWPDIESIIDDYLGL